MSDRVSRRSVFAALAAAVLAPLTARLRAAFGRNAEKAAGTAEQFGVQSQALSATSYSYDELCRHTDETYHKCVTTIYRYDSEGLLIEIIDPTPLVNYTYSYEGQGR